VTPWCTIKPIPQGATETALGVLEVRRLAVLAFTMRYDAPPTFWQRIRRLDGISRPKSIPIRFQRPCAHSSHGMRAYEGDVPQSVKRPALIDWPTTPSSLWVRDARATCGLRRNKPELREDAGRPTSIHRHSNTVMY
jgi:hypothetical protein